MEEKVSVIVPMYNAKNTISRTVDSILAQDYKNIEILIVDDLSSDGSYEFVKEKYLRKYENIKLHKLEQKGGASVSRNLAISLATGKYIAFLDADDTWELGKLKKQVKFMEDNEYVFTYTNFNIINEDGELQKVSNSPHFIDYKTMLKYNMIGCLTVIYNQEIIGKVSIPRIDKRNDYALWLTILKKGFDGYLFNEVLSNYYISSNSLSRQTGKMNLLGYHYKLFRTVLGFNPVSAAFLTLRNAVISLKRRNA